MINISYHIHNKKMTVNDVEGNWAVVMQTKERAV